MSKKYQAVKLTPTEAACKHEAGVFVPVVNFSKCESKAPCVTVCPYDVLDMKPITAADYSTLTFSGKLKTLAHGKDKAYVVQPDRCHACGLCVVVCPENAISLVRVAHIGTQNL
jgi:4Fe-4S ferredoxin